MDKDGFGSLLFAFDFPQKHLELHANDRSKQEKTQANSSVPVVDVLFGMEINSQHHHVPFLQTVVFIYYT